MYTNPAHKVHTSLNLYF